MRKSDRVFTPDVVKDLRGAVTAKVFCRNGSAMVGDGIVWASGRRGRVTLDVVNQ